jgi:hypothetical protein
MKNLNIQFNGFYNSVHDANIDDALESIFDTDEGGEIPDNIDYKNLYNIYSKEWTNKFEEFLNDEILGYCANSERLAGKKSIKLSYIGLNSPKYYNYSTDKIVLDLPPSSAGIVLNYLLDNKEFLEYIKENTKSYDGFISFYTYNDVLNDKDSILIVFALDYMSILFEQKDHYDYEINTYELICSEV